MHVHISPAFLFRREDGQITRESRAADTWSPDSLDASRVFLHAARSVASISYSRAACGTIPLAGRCFDIYERSLFFSAQIASFTPRACAFGSVLGWLLPVGHSRSPQVFGSGETMPYVDLARIRRNTACGVCSVSNLYKVISDACALANDGKNADEILARAQGSVKELPAGNWGLVSVAKKDSSARSLRTCQVATSLRRVGALGGSQGYLRSMPRSMQNTRNRRMSMGPAGVFPHATRRESPLSNARHRAATRRGDGSGRGAYYSLDESNTSTDWIFLRQFWCPYNQDPTI